ncbi:MAG TPA: prepilin-type N-terminal cleavage/methylation domain-containing protein [Spirochaetota bacterium]|nr:prepilin-type N-terminal cleavage/methylation domain-containing protein [Spirochaetota bacterium]
MNKLQQNYGFTLIEMLVAVTLSSIILLMIYSAYSSVIKTVNYSKSVSSFYENLNFAIKRIDNDLANIYWKEESKNLNFISDTFNGSSRLNFVVAEHKENRFIFNLKEQLPLGDVHEVGYYLKPSDKRDTFLLIRRSSIDYDDAPLEGGSEEVILEKVKSLKFDFKYRSDWESTWDSRNLKKIPRLIKTTIVIENNSGQLEQYEFMSIPDIGVE